MFWAWREPIWSRPAFSVSCWASDLFPEQGAIHGRQRGNDTPDDLPVRGLKLSALELGPLRPEDGPVPRPQQVHIHTNPAAGGLETASQHVPCAEFLRDFPRIACKAIGRRRRQPDGGYELGQACEIRNQVVGDAAAES